MIKALIFDLDGTLGDTLPLCIEAFQQAVYPLTGKMLTPGEVLATFGASEEGCIRQLAPDCHEEGIKAFRRCYAELHYKYPDPFPGIRELLEYLSEKGIIAALVTGKGKQSATTSLERFGLGAYFAMQEFGSPQGPRKVEGIRAVLKKFGLQPQEAAYVGDARSDIAYARQAGVAIYSAAWAGTAEYETLKAMQPDQIFTSVEEFAAFITEVLQSGHLNRQMPTPQKSQPLRHRRF